MLPKSSLPFINRGSYDDGRGGDIVLIYKNHIRCIKNESNTTTTGYTKKHIKPFHVIIIYRQLSCSMSAFIEDFGKLIDN